LRKIVSLAALALAVVSSAQIPDVRIKLDVTLSFRSEKGEPPVLKPYSVFGRHSTVGLILYTEPGFRVFVSQKLQKISNEVDEEPLDEFYIEDEGIWRLGKQYIPFGTGAILRESVIGARADTNLILERFPISLGVFDGGAGEQRGVVGRIGTRYGASIAYGRHFGIASTALTQIRRPENSPGKGRGWRTAVGVDYTRRFDQVTVRAEGLALRRGETGLDEDLTLGDVSLTFQPNRNQSLTLGWTRILPSDGDVFRIMGSVRVSSLAFLEPVVRYRNQRLFDLALELRIRF
jgi:hypothetical protein